jgi:hypothetical protein
MTSRDCPHPGMTLDMAFRFNQASPVDVSGTHEIKDSRGSGLGRYDNGRITDNHGRLVGFAQRSHCECGIEQRAYTSVDGREVTYEEELFRNHDQSLRTADPSVRRRNMGRNGRKARVIITSDSSFIEYDPSLENPYVVNSQWFKDMVRKMSEDHGISEDKARATILILMQ